MADALPSEARAWMIKAWRDLETARRTVTGEPPFCDVAVYHCQQAAEKSVKAFLVYHGKAYERTHDIEVLVDLASEIHADFIRLADAADALTPYATRFRYPNATFAVEPQPTEYDEAFKYEVCRSNLPLRVEPASGRRSTLSTINPAARKCAVNSPHVRTRRP